MNQPNSFSRHITTGLVVFALALICIWPAILNRQPLFFADTTAYIRGAASGVSRFLHHETAWTADASAVLPSDSPLNDTEKGSFSDRLHKTVLAGRSVYYGAILYLSQLADGRFWPAVLFQALVVLLALALTLDAFGFYTLKSLALVTLYLSAATPLAFFISYLMPDVFASIAILACANLAIAGHRMRRWVLITWTGLLAMAMLFHDAHLLIVVALLIVIAGCFLVAGLPLSRRAVLSSMVALSIALCGQMAFSFITKSTVGTTPIRPPFLSARLIADGPGYSYLLHACPASDLELCKYTTRLKALRKAAVTRPLSDEFLWNVDPAIGVFSAVNSEARRKIADEQFKFVTRTLQFDPAGVLQSFVTNSWHQLCMVSLNEFNLDSGGRGFFESHVPQPYLTEVEASRIWLDQMPTKGISELSTFVLIASIVLSIACALVWKPLSLPADGMRSFSLITVAGVLLNAIICGSLSTPHDRYEARVIWLIPFVAILLLRTVSKTLRLRAGFAVVPAELNQRASAPVTV